MRHQVPIPDLKSQTPGNRARLRHDWAISLSLFTFMHWRRKWQPTPVFLPGESQGWGSWWAAVYGVAQSWTWLKRLSSSRSSSRSRSPERPRHSTRDVPFHRHCGPGREGTRGQNTPAFFILSTLFSSANPTVCQLHLRAGKSGCVLNRGQFSGAQNGERVGKREVEEKAENILQRDENRHHYR